jgi:hypothetical protein
VTSNAKPPRMQLLGARHCPNVEPTRQRLREVLASEGLPPVFEEVDLDDARTLPALRQWGSPTVLVDGEDVAGGAATSGATCRLYPGEVLAGVPQDALIRAAIQRAMASPRSARMDLLTRRGGLWIWGVPAILVIAGSFLGRLGHLALWVPAFTVAGAACVVNARRCRRIHCHVTGPLFLLAAAVTALVAADLVRVEFGTVLAVTAAVFLASFVPEVLMGRKYFVAQEPAGSPTTTSRS